MEPPPVPGLVAVGGVQIRQLCRPHGDHLHRVPRRGQEDGVGRQVCEVLEFLFPFVLLIHRVPDIFPRAVWLSSTCCGSPT